MERVGLGSDSVPTRPMPDEDEGPPTIDEEAKQGEFEGANPPTPDKDEGANPPTLGEFKLRKPRWRKLFRISPLTDIETRFTGVDWAAAPPSAKKDQNPTKRLAGP